MKESRKDVPGAIALALCAMGLVCVSIGYARKETPVDLSLTSLDGGKVHLHDLAGKIVVLNMWATWCGPCREEIPMLVEAEKVWGPKGVSFIAASLDDNKTRKKIPDFVREFHLSFPVWAGATLGDLAKLHLGNSVPDTAFIDRDGIIFARVRGEIGRSELEERLEWATSDRSRSSPQPEVTHLDK